MARSGVGWDSAHDVGALDRVLALMNAADRADWPDAASRGAALVGALDAALEALRPATATHALRELLTRGQPQAVVDALFDFPHTRLAAYGTLRPGESNHALLADVAGTWVAGTVPGVRFTANGFPAFVWRPGENRPVQVSVLTSAALPAHWARLDEFEGADYRRVLVSVELPSGAALVACLYAYIGPIAPPA